jgi:hypothetical protein
MHVCCVHVLWLTDNFHSSLLGFLGSSSFFYATILGILKKNIFGQSGRHQDGFCIEDADCTLDVIDTEHLVFRNTDNVMAVPAAAASSSPPAPEFLPVCRDNQCTVVHACGPSECTPEEYCCNQACGFCVSLENDVGCNTGLICLLEEGRGSNSSEQEENEDNNNSIGIICQDDHDCLELVGCNNNGANNTAYCPSSVACQRGRCVPLEQCGDNPYHYCGVEEFCCQDPNCGDYCVSNRETCAPDPDAECEVGGDRTDDEIVPEVCTGMKITRMTFLGNFQSLLAPIFFFQNSSLASYYIIFKMALRRWNLVCKPVIVPIPLPFAWAIKTHVRKLYVIWENVKSCNPVDVTMFVMRMNIVATPIVESVPS